MKTIKAVKIKAKNRNRLPMFLKNLSQIKLLLFKSILTTLCFLVIRNLIWEFMPFVPIIEIWPYGFTGVALPGSPMSLITQKTSKILEATLPTYKFKNIVQIMTLYGVVNGLLGSSNTFYIQGTGNSKSINAFMA